MADENRNGTKPTVSTDVVEFNWPLYVYKRRLQGHTDHLYSIAVWRGTTLISICLMQPLDAAVAALADLLRQASSSECANAAQQVSLAIPVPGDGSGNICGHDAKQ